MAADRPRFSIRSLLVLIAASGLIAVSLARASIYWASLCFSLALLILAISCIAAIFRRGAKRAYWIGFLFLGVGYMMLMYSPVLDRLIGHRLITTKMLGYLESSLRQTEDELSGAFRTTSVSSAIDPLPEAMITYPSEDSPRLPQWGYFQEAGHSAFAILLACLGGAAARYFFLTSHEPLSS